jgi:hypothetical protein
MQQRDQNKQHRGGQRHHGNQVHAADVSHKERRTIVPNSAPRSALNGRQSLNISINPTANATMTESVETCGFVKFSGPLNSVKNKTPRIIVRAEGNDFFKTFAKKLPLIRSLFGSSASTNDGIPIVSELTNVRWIGSNGIGSRQEDEQHAEHRSNRLFSAKTAMRSAAGC